MKKKKKGVCSLWRILRSDVPNCLIASGATNSAHGDAWNQENENDCWNYVEAYNTTTTADISSTANSVVVNDSSYFPNSGSVQIGSEYVNYSGNTGNTLTGLTRGVRQTGTIPNDISSTFTGEIALNGSNTQIGFWGGYLQIDGGEVVKVNYNKFVYNIKFKDSHGK